MPLSFLYFINHTSPPTLLSVGLKLYSYMSYRSDAEQQMKNHSRDLKSDKAIYFFSFSFLVSVLMQVIAEVQNAVVD